jgi:hypothetical protein
MKGQMAIISRPEVLSSLLLMPDRMALAEQPLQRNDESIELEWKTVLP